jgi:hypothetical protein
MAGHLMMIEEEQTKYLLMEFFWRAKGYRGFLGMQHVSDDALIGELSLRIGEHPALGGWNDSQR